MDNGPSLISSITLPPSSPSPSFSDSTPGGGSLLNGPHSYTQASEGLKVSWGFLTFLQPWGQVKTVRSYLSKIMAYVNLFFWTFFFFFVYVCSSHGRPSLLKWLSSSVEQLVILPLTCEPGFGSFFFIFSPLISSAATWASEFSESDGWKSRTGTRSGWRDSQPPSDRQR